MVRHAEEEDVEEESPDDPEKALARLQELAALAAPKVGTWAFACDHEDEGSEAMPPLPVSRDYLRAPEEEERRAFLTLAATDKALAVRPLDFVEAMWFQTMVGGVIAANAVTIGFETDVESRYWPLLEHTLLVFFVLEFILRWCHWGWEFFSTMSNMLDVFIVAAGVFDLWVMPVMFMGREHRRNAFVPVFQVLRLLRIIRLVRLVKVVQPLYKLALGIAEALQGMFWVLVFLSMMLYAVAILCTRTLGRSDFIPGERAEHWDGHAESAAEARAMFHSVFSSMFVLFELMSCWSLMVFTPFFQKLPLARLFAVMFYVLTAWALLAVMTGVVSEKMLAVSEQLTYEDKDIEKAHSRKAAAQLGHVLAKADSDNVGSMTREQFNAMLQCEDLLQPLLKASVLSNEDLVELFQFLDRNEDGSVRVSEYLAYMVRLNDKLSPKGLLKMMEELSGDLRNLEKRMLTRINERFDLLTAAVSRPLRKIHAIAEQLQRLDVALCDARAGILGPDVYTRVTCSELDDAEARLARRIQALHEAVDQIARLQAAGAIHFAAPLRNSTSMRGHARWSAGSGTKAQGAADRAAAA